MNVIHEYELSYSINVSIFLRLTYTPLHVDHLCTLIIYRSSIQSIVRFRGACTCMSDFTLTLEGLVLSLSPT